METMTGTPTAPDISVVIPTFNRAGMVCDCVASVLAQTGVMVEVIVVDDCSPDDTQVRIAQRFGGDPRVKYVRNGENSFQAVSRNNGARIARGEYILFLDDDNILESNALVNLWKEFKERPQLGLAAPMAIHKRPGKENLIWSLGSDFNRWTSRPMDNCPNLPLEELPSEPKTYPTSYYPNGFMVPKKIYEAVGGFDEMYEQIFEESDFGLKIREAGYDAVVSTNARTVHLGFLEPGCVAELRQLGIEKPYRTYCFARNRLYFARRHFSFLQTLSVTLVFAPLSAAYYGLVALKNKRLDIAWAYLKGTICGIFGIGYGKER